MGIEREGFESHDHYERHLIQLLNNEFGASAVSSYVSTKIVYVNGLPVCVVNCEKVKGEEIVYLDGHVYVRTGPRIDELSVEQVVDHLKRRQKES